MIITAGKLKDVIANTAIYNSTEVVVSDINESTDTVGLGIVSKITRDKIYNPIEKVELSGNTLIIWYDSKELI